MILRTLGILLVGLSAQDGEPTPYERAIPRFEIRVSGQPGAETIDVVATRASLEALLKLIGRETNRQIVGLELLSRDPEITAKLASEDLRDAMHWIGGSVGLSIIVKTTEIQVSEDLPPYPTRQRLFDKASTGYFRAVVDHPNSVSAPRAAWDSAEIEASRPDRTLETARAFDSITVTYPKSDLVPKALLRAGLAFGEANAWDEAATRFDALAGLSTKHDYPLTARRLLADAHTQIAAAARNPLVAAENARRALLVLDALDDRDPNASPFERRARAIVRSRAHSLVGEPVEALKALDIAEKYSDDGRNDVELAELRAHAFERSERYGDAVRAWLRYGDLAGGETKVEAFVRAAKAANNGREHLTALAIAKTARNEGFGAALAPAEAAAWAALDMEPTRTDLFGDPERLERGEVLVRHKKFDQAIDALRPVFERRQSLTEGESKRLALAYGRALAEQGRIDEAMLAFRRLAETQRRGADRRDLYLFAADLLEAAGEIERAILALEGQL